MINSNLLKSKIVLNGDNTIELGKYLGISLNSLYNKMNNKSDFKLEEIKKIKTRYNLSAEELSYIFFNQ